MTAARLAIVGGSLAATRAVAAARALPFTGDITVIGAEPHAAYDRTALSKKFLAPDSTSAPRRLAADQPEDPATTYLLGTSATGLDTTRRVVSAGDREVPYDILIIATGSEPRALRGAPGPDVAGVTTLRNLEDAAHVREGLDQGSRIAIIGAGFIGAEVASAARLRGLAVTIIEAQRTPLVRAIGPEGAQVCVDLHTAAGTDLRLGCTVTEWETVRRNGRTSISALTLSDGSRVPADLVVIGVGTRPATAWLAGSGIELDPTDGSVLTDSQLRTNVPGIYAAGDVARFPHPTRSDATLRTEHWTAASELGALAARNALDPEQARPAGTVPYFWSDWYGHRIQFVGESSGEPPQVLFDDRATGGGYLALSLRDSRICGIFALDSAHLIMKFRRLLGTKSAEQAEQLARILSVNAARSRSTGVLAEAPRA